ncbi:lariat debranching enzyme, C-terminal domain-containing protein [Poronia punctata]|nr:lariat debranching enzyme, C-terminal domain-containing protein [Poronia punctata]
MSESGTFEADGVRVAVEGCGHGTLDAIYASVTTASKAQGWDGVDLVIINGDFQAVRNAADLSVMSVPAKYKKLGDFPAYYSGEKTAPYLTLFIAGNHEASSHLWELYYGGWVAPNIYYMGAANVLRFGPLRIAGMSGIWKGFDYRRPHHERLPFRHEDVKSFYHVREIDVRKLLLLREQVDVGLSHDWPRAIENHGDAEALWRIKPFFKKESIEGTLGNPAATYVMDRLRPAYWFSAHMHCKFAAIKKYDAPSTTTTTSQTEGENTDDAVLPATTTTTAAEPQQQTSGNPDEIDLDDDEDDVEEAAPPNTSTIPSDPQQQQQQQQQQPSSSSVAEDLRAQLPASFAAPPKQEKKHVYNSKPKINPGQPVPASITNTTTRFLALDKCLPGRKFLQLSTLQPLDPSQSTQYPPMAGKKPRYSLQYDPEWLAINRVFAQYLTIGDASTPVPPDLGEEVYVPLIDAERAWVEENIVRAGKLAVPENFEFTAAPRREGDPEAVSYQPDEYTNPQTVAFCELLGVKNLWDASAEERAERKPTRNRGGGNRGRGRGGFRGGR